MQEDWLKDIYGKMSDFEADEPSGLWDDICKARQQDKDRNRLIEVKQSFVVDKTDCSGCGNGSIHFLRRLSGGE